MDEEMMARAQSDAAEIEAVADMTQLEELGNQALVLEDQIAASEAQTELLKKDLESLMRYKIPQALSVAGIPEYGFDGPRGRCRIVKEIKVVGSLSNVENPDDAIAYLEESGMSGTIKSQLTVDFRPDEKEKADEASVDLARLTGKNPILTRTVHPQTLMAFVRQKINEEEAFDYERVGCVAFPQARFSKRR